VDDRDVALIELIPQLRGALCMQLNCDNACTCRDECAGN
jgi:hypothetical protein